MSKTPKELAEEYSQIIKASQDVDLDDLSWSLISEWEAESFLAGYQASAPQWISVKDRLPPSETEVLWWNKTARQAGVSSWEYMSHCNDTMLYWGDAGNVSIKNFTHWMPLPAAPNEGL